MRIRNSKYDFSFSINRIYESCWFNLEGDSINATASTIINLKIIYSYSYSIVQT